MSKSDRMIWSTTCNSCLSNLAVWPHWEADDDIPNPEEWDGQKTAPYAGTTSTGNLETQ